MPDQTHAPPARLVVCISGSGTNLQAILDAWSSGSLPAQVVLVVSNRKDAYGIVRAEQAGVSTLYAPFKPYREAGRTRDEYDSDLAEQITQAQPDLIVLAGWMHIFGSAFIERFAGRLINLHPALPGQFPGTHAIERAFAAFQAGDIQASGCMVHWVIPEVDAGPVIAQAVVPFQPHDTLDAYAERLHTAERHLLVEAIAVVVRELEVRGTASAA